MNTQMRRCEHCGKPISASTRFCSNCGTPVMGTSTNNFHQAPDQTHPTTSRNVNLNTPPQMPIGQPPKRKGMLWWGGLAGITLLSLCICVVAAGAGVYFLAPEWLNLDFADIQTADNTEYPTAAGKALETLPLAPGGVVSDSRGALIAMPALPQPEGYQTALVVSEPGGQLGRALKKDFGEDIVLYSLTPGAVDGIGAMDLSIPAPSADSRLAVLVDGTGLIVYPDGQLTVS